MPMDRRSNLKQPAAHIQGTRNTIAVAANVFAMSLSGHGISLIVANRLAWASCAAGFAVSFVITIAQLIAQLNVRS